MKFEKIHNKGQARLFKNQYLEYLTKTHPLVIWGLYLPVIFFMLYYCKVKLAMGGSNIAFLFIAGMFSWSLFEYLMHRFLFHLVSENKKVTQVIYVMHGNHHEYPRDKERLFMPPVPSLISATLVFLLMYLPAEALHYGKYAFVFFPGFLLGYLAYGSMHYAIHAWKPPFKWMKPLWRNHHLHHYMNMELGFGVSSTLWDHVFGTMFNLKEKKEEEDKKERESDLVFRNSYKVKKELISEN
jgi:4-hydroxysphinganine ceramide fatty acyl 2-hydroxylase